MNKSPVISLPDVILSSRPKEVVEDALIKLLTNRFKEIKILWNASVFRKALANSKLPGHLLSKLEELIAIAEASDWHISNSLKMELDETVEDIESFNQRFTGRTKKFQNGKLVTLKELKHTLA